MNQVINEIEVNGTKYVRADAASASPSGSRVVLVVDRGWIFAGDITREGGRIKLSRALHVFSWQSSGFSVLLDDPKKAKADLRKCADVDVPESAEIFCVPVSENWGL